MRDSSIRKLLRQTTLSDHVHDSNSKVVEEMKIHAAGARIDIAVINGHLHGYEIKSAVDTLQRLPYQIDAYSKVFDFITVVTEVKYSERLLKILPPWVGVMVCTDNADPNIASIRTATFNRDKEGFYLAKLLWRSELLECLTEQKITFRKADRNWILAENLALNLDIETLSGLVRLMLKKREDWASEL